MPPRRPRRWTEAEVAEDLTRQYEGLLRDLLALQLDALSCRKPHFLSLAPAAKREWVAWFEAWGRRQDDAQDEQAAALAKLESYAARLGLLHHVVTHVAVQTEDLRPVGEQSLGTGIRLAEWFAAEALRVYQSLRESEDQRRLRELIEWVEGRGGQVTPWRVSDSMRTRYPTSEEAKADLEELVKVGRGEWIERPSGVHGGRPPGKLFQLKNGARITGKTPVEMAGTATELEGQSAGETPSDTQNHRATTGLPGFPAPFQRTALAASMTLRRRFSGRRLVMPRSATAAENRERKVDRSPILGGLIRYARSISDRRRSARLVRRMGPPRACPLAAALPRRDARCLSGRAATPRSPRDGQVGAPGISRPKQRCETTMTTRPVPAARRLGQNVTY